MGKVNACIYTASKYCIQRTLLRNRIMITNIKATRKQNENTVYQKGRKGRNEQKQEKKIHADIFVARDHLYVKIA